MDSRPIIDEKLLPPTPEVKPKDTSKPPPVCDCDKKRDEDEISRIPEIEAEQIIEFENALHNVVYVK